MAFNGHQQVRGEIVLKVGNQQKNRYQKNIL